MHFKVLFPVSDPVNVEFTPKASFIVEDASERIFLVCNQESDIQTILQLSDADWKTCQSQAKKSGELLYLNGKRAENCGGKANYGGQMENGLMTNVPR